MVIKGADHDALPAGVRHFPGGGHVGYGDQEGEEVLAN
jgi:hypothetical protein